uniref:Uncharacterized protein n=1 Tax=Chromera velia CCMP2878 TaxID=1169474 RepID=A0A0G4IA11_9ALVE|eukprot:Cvel_2093.t1-p1 / transcript=Cvel_2093.t1 / gene=Cvel_2093 / organism=Chromera_velia_CCMP2878 / gene_product=hypothetical protein / transcript_product=hypothetical protein / location=Cvel_scaffold80:132867-133856(+) / protein_length=330 / sequence_SO=supercontig / SO=protein_coding / is_pseudo=false
MNQNEDLSNPPSESPAAAAAAMALKGMHFLDHSIGAHIPLIFSGTSSQVPVIHPHAERASSLEMREEEKNCCREGRWSRERVESQQGGEKEKKEGRWKALQAEQKVKEQGREGRRLTKCPSTSALKTSRAPLKFLSQRTSMQFLSHLRMRPLRYIHGQLRSQRSSCKDCGGEGLWEDGNHERERNEWEERDAPSSFDGAQVRAAAAAATTSAGPSLSCRDVLFSRRGKKRERGSPDEGGCLSISTKGRGAEGGRNRGEGVSRSRSTETPQSPSEGGKNKNKKEGMKAKEGEVPEERRPSKGPKTGAGKRNKTCREHQNPSSGSLLCQKAS